MPYKSESILVFLFRTYPLTFLAVIGGLTLAGFLEGITAAAFLPLISDMTGQEFSGGMAAEVMGRVQDLFSVTFTPRLLLASIVVMMLIRAAVLLAVYAQASHAASHVVNDLRLRYLNGLMKASWRHFLSQKAGAAANTLGTEAMRTVVAFRAACSFAASSIQVLCYAALALAVSWKISVAAVVCGGIIMGLLSWLVKIGRKAGHAQTDLYNEVMARITDTIYGLKPVKAMNLVDPVMDVVRQDIDKLKSAQVRTEFSDHALRILSEFLIVALVALGLGVLSSQALMTTPEILFMAFVFLRLAMRLSAAQRYYHNMATCESALTSIQKKIDVLAASEEEGDNAAAGAAPALQKDVAFSNVSFHYGGSPVLDHLDIVLPAFKLTAVYGPSGSGKTTFIDLLCALFAPAQGKILVDGVDLQAIPLRSWRSSLGYVPQDVVLFHDTIRNNLLLGRAGIGDDDLWAALRLAQAEEFVRGLPDGLDTVTGERGAKISGGQRQRIALARALAGRPGLLILDEVTSALDAATEQALLKTIRDLTESVTVVMVTHSAAVRAYADNFYELGAQPVLARAVSE